MSGLKITDVRVLVMQGNFAWPIVRIETDAGLIGYGEAFTDVCVERVKRAILDRRDALIGQDPTAVLPLVRRLGLSPFDLIACKAISGIEMALWDLAGQAVGAPVYQLLGGRLRDKVRIYCDCHGGQPIRSRADYSYANPDDYTPEAFAANARWIKKLGFSLLKFDLYGAPVELVGEHDAMYSMRHMDYCTAVVEALREEVGWDVDLAIDYGGKAVSDAIRLIDRVEHIRLAWAEDIVPLNGLNVRAMAEVTRAVKTPTLTGEILPTALAFRELIDAQAIRVVAPDMAVVGGIDQMRQVSRMADAQHLLIAPHNICSPIGTMAAVHACSTMANFVGLEFHAVGTPWWQDVIQHDGDIIDGQGMIAVPDGPGLGIEVNHAVIAEHLLPGEEPFE